MYRKTGDYAWFFVILITFIGIFVLPSFVRTLWLPDEPRYVQVAREMKATGNWIIPHLNGSVYDQKPPLYFWLVASSATLWNSWKTQALVFPTLLSASGCLLFTYLFSILLFRQKLAALLSVLVLMSSVMFVGTGQIVRMDMLLVFCITGALCCFYRVYTRSTSCVWGDTLAFFLLAALGTLTKGPIGLGLPGLIVLVFLSWNKDLAFLKKCSLVLPGLLVYGVVVLAWFIPAVAQQGWEYAYLILIKQNFGRVYQSWIHARPWYFYLYSFPWMFLPWFPFWVSAAISTSQTSRTQDERQAVRLLWSWWGTTFLFFSLVSGKLEIYLLPLFPATAIVVGKFWATYLGATPSKKERSCYVTFPAYVLGSLLLVGSLLLIARGETQSYWRGIIMLEGLGGFLLYAALKRHFRLLFVGVVSITCITVFYSLGSVLPLLNQQFTFRAQDRALNQFSISDGMLAAWQEFPLEARFFIPANIKILASSQDAEQFFSSNRPVYCFVRKSRLEQMKHVIHRPLYALATYAIKNKRYTLISQYMEGFSSQQ